jgi:hypothetical protein
MEGTNPMIKKHFRGYRDAVLVIAAALAFGAGVDVLRSADWSAIIATANDIATTDEDLEQWQTIKRRQP